MHSRDSDTTPPRTHSPRKRQLVGGANAAAPTRPRGHERDDDGDAFIPDPHGGPAHTRDDLAENLAEEFLASATSGEETIEDHRDETYAEELGGPFVPANAEDEFADTTDDTNPADGAKEPFPTANHSPK
jgi:hypothetical protein